MQVHVRPVEGTMAGGGLGERQVGRQHVRARAGAHLLQGGLQGAFAFAEASQQQVQFALYK
ncbi:hypothetical protein D3C81_1809200 [compost metagenome]